jgi:hypothetical protein
MAMVLIICNSEVRGWFYLASIGELAKKKTYWQGILSIGFWVQYTIYSSSVLYEILSSLIFSIQSWKSWGSSVSKRIISLWDEQNLMFWHVALVS